MAAVSTPYRGNPRGMARCRQPVMNGGPDSAAFQWRLALALMPCDEEQHPVSCSNRALQPMIDGLPGAIETVAVEIDRSIGHDPSAFKSPIPIAVERRLVKIFAPNWRQFSWPWFRKPSPGPARHGRGRRGGRQINRIARQRSDRRSHPGPQRGLVRGQVAHGPPSPSVAGPGPDLSPTSRRPSFVPPRPRPRRYRSGWRP